MSQRTSVPLPSFVGVGVGTGSGGPHVPRFQLFVGESLSGVTVTVLLTWLIVAVAAFHVPKTSVGGLPVPPYCQSPARGLVLPGGTLKSVMNNAGNMGRPDG